MGLSRSVPGPLRPPTAEDLRFLAWQLGRPPRGVLGVKPCPHEFPQVILNHPLLSPHPEGGDGVRGSLEGRAEGRELEPMPTLFWLTCPFLVEEVSKLESKGAVKRYEGLLAADEELLGAYVQSHEAYKRERLSLLSYVELAWAKAQGLDSLLSAGIAGISNPRRVKCLHAHLAHFLATGQNPIGALVVKELKELVCPDRHCAQALSA